MLALGLKNTWTVTSLGMSWAAAARRMNNSECQQYDTPARIKRNRVPYMLRTVRVRMVNIRR